MTTPSFASTLQRRLAACGDPGTAPRELAELFRWTFDASRDAAALRDALHAHLLRWTIGQARHHTRYYARPAYEPSTDGAAEAPADVTRWPVIRRHDVAEQLDAFHADNVAFGSVSHTSGCTGAALPVYRSAEELAFLWDYQVQLLAPVRRKLAARPLVLSMPNLYHGAAVPVPSLGKVFAAGVTDDLLLGDLIKLVRQRFRIPGHEDRISTISGLAHQILFLTHFLREQAIDPRELQIKHINLVGGYVPARRRAYLADAWGATVFDRFSLTESVGGATRCHACGYFHLDPHVIGEVLDVDTGAPIAQGVGRLVLTQLYPFVQMQPLVRYDTGDLVRRVACACSTALTFEFAGKAVNCVGWRPPAAGTEWLVLSVPLHEVLDPIPDFARVEQFRGVRSTSDPSVGSLPLYTLTAHEPRPGALRIVLTLELRYAPHFYPDRVAALRAEIHDGIARAHPTLGARIGEGSVELEIAFTSPRSLPGAGILKI
jgi:hypothetical protein